MKIRLWFAIVLILTLIHVDIKAQKKKETISDPLIGKWETVHNPLESSRLILEFRKNKTFSYLLESNWNGSYKLNGTKLITNTSIPILNKIKADTSTILIYSDTLVQISKIRGKEVTTKMIRQGKSSKLGSGIIGSWAMKDSDAEHSTINFNSDGNFQIKNILKSFKGNYITKKDTVTVFSYGLQMMKNRFVFDKGLLLLYSKTQSAPIKLERSKK